MSDCSRRRDGTICGRRIWFIVSCDDEGVDREDLSEEEEDGELHLWDRNWCDGWVRSSSVNGSVDG